MAFKWMHWLVVILLATLVLLREAVPVAESSTKLSVDDLPRRVEVLETNLLTISETLKRIEQALAAGKTEFKGDISSLKTELKEDIGRLVGVKADGAKITRDDTIGDAKGDRVNRDLTFLELFLGAIVVAATLLMES